MRGQNTAISIVAGVLTYLVLAVVINLGTGGAVASLLLFVGLAVAVVVGFRVNRVLQRRVAQAEGNKDDEAAG